MNAIKNILGVANYERKMLLRTVRFRLLGGIGVAIPVILGIMLAIAESYGMESESITGLGAFVPFYAYSYLQTIVIAFIVGDFRAGDERAGVYEVIASRPISTFELVAGKYLGVIGAMFTLSLGVLVLTLVIQAAKVSMTGMPLTVRPYLGYLILMNVPALIFVSALTFFLGAVLRRQSAVTLVVIAYTLAVIFFLGRRYGGVYDFGAFFSPLFYSDLIGLGNIARVVEQRLFYMALAVFFFGLSVERYPRLPQSVGWTWLGRGVVGAGMVLAAGIYINMELRDASAEGYRRSFYEEQIHLASRPMPVALHYGMRARVMSDGVPLRAEVTVQIQNNEESVIDTLVFLLNPGFELTAVSDDSGRPVQWARRMGMVALPTPLGPGERASYRFDYAGDVDLDGFDLLRADDLRRLPARTGPVMKGDMTAWIRDRSIFLPPRCAWYPRPGVDYGHTEGRPVSFATADIRVDLPAGLEMVTQGDPVTRTTDADRTVHTWSVTDPVPQFSLNAGEYSVYTDTLGGVACAVYVHPVHKKQITFFEDIKDEAREALEQIMDSLEQETGLAYPYGRLSVVEVPFQVQWYYETWRESGGLTQPGVLMVEENVLLGLRLGMRLRWRTRRSRGNADPSRIKRDLLVSSVLRTFLANESSRAGIYRSPVVQLWSFDKAFEGENHALMDRGMPVFMQQDLNSGLTQSLFSGSGRRMGGRFRRPRGGRTESERTWDSLVVQLDARAFSDLDPESEAALYRAAVDAKGASLFRLIKAEMGDEGFQTALGSFSEAFRYRNTSFDDFEKATVTDTSANRQGTNLKRLVHDWLHSTRVPGYTLTRVKANKVDDGTGWIAYQVIVRIRNGEAGRGYVQVTAQGREDEVSKGVEIEPGQEVEVAMILWDRPTRVSVDPFFARNRRPLMSPLRIPDEPVDGPAQSYVREVPPEDAAFTEVIVDNEDEGFSLPIRRLQRFLRPQLKGDNWREGELPFSYGRYETSYRWKHPGDGAQPAVWEARIPHAGEYDVSFYMPPSRMQRRLRLADTFTLEVTHTAGADTLSLETSGQRGGWAVLGRYRFDAGQTASVTLSDRAGNRLYADAVRWRFVDPDRPHDLQDEDVPSWSWGRPGFGRSGGGGRGR